jgi:RNA polymerase sigma-70 factor (ECF subfamily)
VKEEMTDENIMVLTASPETMEDGFRGLVAKYQQRLYHVIRNRVASHEDADDVLQNTFLKVFKNISAFEGRSGLFTWMYSIAANEVNNHHKKSKRLKVEALDGKDYYQAEAYVNTAGLEKKIEAIISHLPSRQQMVFRMRYYDELTYKEIASLLDLTEGALKASFHHAVKKIEQELIASQIE